ncbi:MAG: hypothetical protein D6806_05815 [Deltaproteobacteria bacterium]|nr:MAG: hypothetical protein D6806_05815 [Deltaproteobacteria bacterium]
MEFTVKIPQIALEAGGLSQFLGGSGGGYGTLGHRAGIFNLAWFYPILAAWKKGGWDMAPAARFGDFANQDVANYLVRLKVPAGTRVASTGVELGRRPSGDGRVELFLAAAGVRHFAIQASAGYEIFESTSGGTKVRVFTYGKNESLARRLAEEASRALRWLEKRLVAYPFTELDVAVAPLVQGAGGMEHPGLAVVADMAVDPPLAGPMAGVARQLLESFNVAEFVVDHEVAHQWFQVLVGTDQSAEPYVDEPLANYLAVMAFEDLHGSRKAEQQLELQLVLPIQLWFALGGRDGVVARPAGGFADQLEYTAFIYGKGSLFYHALRRRAGKKRLLKCLSGVCRDFGFRRLDSSALFSGLGKCLRMRGFAALRDRWFHSRKIVEDLKRLGFRWGRSIDELFGLLAGAGAGGGNVKFGGQMNEALLKAFQQALEQLAAP